MNSTPGTTNPFSTGMSQQTTHFPQLATPFTPNPSRTIIAPIQNTPSIPPSANENPPGTLNKSTVTGFVPSKPTSSLIKPNQNDLQNKNSIPASISSSTGIKTLDPKELSILKKRCITDVMQQSIKSIPKNLNLFNSLIHETIEAENSTYSMLKNLILIQIGLEEMQKKRMEIEDCTQMMQTEQDTLFKVLDQVSTGLDQAIGLSGFHIPCEKKDSIYNVGSASIGVIDSVEESLLKIAESTNKKLGSHDSEDNLNRVIENCLECLDWVENQVEKNNEKLLKIEEACMYILK